MPVVSPDSAVDLPVSSQLTFFDLYLLNVCDIGFLGPILHCMSHLRRFMITLNAIESVASYVVHLLDGHFWQDLLINHAPSLTKFDFLIAMNKWTPSVDLDVIVNSFQYFVTRYDGWHMAASRWQFCENIRSKSKSNTRLCQ